MKLHEHCKNNLGGIKFICFHDPTTYTSMYSNKYLKIITSLRKHANVISNDFFKGFKNDNFKLKNWYFSYFCSKY